MVIKMLPNQISDSWEYIKYGIMSTKPAMSEITPESVIKVLENLLIGTVQCWGIIDKETDTSPEVLYGFVLTTIADDYISGLRFLNIYDLFSFKPLKPGTLEGCFKAVKEFAVASGCRRIVAYSDIPDMIRLAKDLGFYTGCVYLIKEI